MIKKLGKCLFVLAALTIGTSAYAVPITWTLKDVTFTDGATASGSFVFDADTKEFSNWSIFTTEGTGGFNLPARSYTATNSYKKTPLAVVPGYFGTKFWMEIISTEFFHPNRNDLPSVFRIGTTEALTNAGGIIGLDQSQAGECYNCSRWRSFASGSVVGRELNNVPAPAGGLLLVMGLAAVYWRRRNG